MSARIISEDTALETQGEELGFTEARLHAHPLTASLGAEFTKLLVGEWFPLLNQRWQLAYDVHRAEARVWVVDVKLDKFVDRFHGALLRAVGNDTNDARYTSLMKGKRPFELKRPTLKGQLAQMEEWPKKLEEKAYDGLGEVRAFLPELVGLIAEAKAAQAAEEDAKSKSQNFRTIGERQAFTAKLNALRKATVGKLDEMVHNLPGEALPGDFSDWFFLKPTREEAKNPTAQDLDAQIKAMELQLANLRKEYDEAVAREATAAEQEQLRHEKEARLAQARQRQREAAAEAAALEAELKQR